MKNKITIFFLMMIFLSFNSISAEKEIIQYMQTQNTKLSTKDAQLIYKNVLYYSNKYEIDPVLVFSVMKTESHFKHSTVSSAGAKGLMQLMPVNFKEFNVNNSIEGNIKGGIMHLKRDLDRFKNTTDTLAAYNAGPSRAVTGEWKKFKETTKYITKINNVYPEIKDLFYLNNKNYQYTYQDQEDDTREVPKQLSKQEKFQRSNIGFKRAELEKE